MPYHSAGRVGPLNWYRAQRLQVVPVFQQPSFDVVTAVFQVSRLNPLRLFDLPIANVTTHQAIQIITDNLKQAHYSPVYFINAHCVNVAFQQPRYAALLKKNALNFADGVGVSIAARAHGKKLVDNVNGTDMFPPLCEALADQGATVFLLGGEPGVAEELGSRLTEKYPGLQIVGCHHGHFAETESCNIAHAIRESHASVLFVAMGVPRQELWIAHWGHETGAKAVLAVGGLFNFYAGKIPRAPVWMRKAKLEWLHRLVQEPKRMWRRYLIGNFVFLTRTLLFPISQIFNTTMLHLSLKTKSSARG